MESFWIIFRLASSCFCMLALLTVMSGFKCGRRRAWLSMTAVTVFCSAFNLCLYFVLGRETMMRVFALSLALPSLAVLLFLTDDKPSQIFFNFFTCVNVLYLAAILGHLTDRLEQVWPDALFRLFFYGAVIWIFQKFLASPYQFLAKNMEKGWRIISAIPFLCFSLVMLMGLYPSVRNDNFLFVIILYLIMCFVYYVIYQIFKSTYDLLKQKETEQLLAMQIEAQETQIGLLEESSSRIRLLRHDMRHYVQGIAALLQQGNTQEALRLLEHYDEKFQKTEMGRYCSDPLLNTILSHYIGTAQARGIRVEAKIDLPSRLPADAAELAIVFSNAIENAVHACSQLPEGEEKYIVIRCTGAPKLGIEISNTYAGCVRFEKDGLPASSEPGHGWGTRSIAAFAQKYNALLDYEADGRVFRLMLLIQ